VKSQVLFLEETVTPDQVGPVIADIFYGTMNLSSAILTEAQVDDFFRCLVEALTTQINRLITSSLTPEEKAVKFTLGYINTLFSGAVCDCSPSQTCSLFTNLQTSALHVGEEMGSEVRDMLSQVLASSSRVELLQQEYHDLVHTALQANAEELFLTPKDIENAELLYFQRCAESFDNLAELFNAMLLEDSQFYTDLLVYIFESHFVEATRYTLAGFTPQSTFTPEEFALFSQLVSENICKTLENSDPPSKTPLDVATVISFEYFVTVYNNLPQDVELTQKQVDQSFLCLAKKLPLEPCNSMTLELVSSCLKF
jgi:hypothetical protein